MLLKLVELVLLLAVDDPAELVLPPPELLDPALPDPLEDKPPEVVPTELLVPCELVSPLAVDDRAELVAPPPEVLDPALPVWRDPLDDKPPEVVPTKPLVPCELVPPPASPAFCEREPASSNTSLWLTPQPRTKSGESARIRTLQARFIRRPPLEVPTYRSEPDESCPRLSGRAARRDRFSTLANDPPCVPKHAERNSNFRSTARIASRAPARPPRRRPEAALTDPRRRPASSRRC
jgi:hypothetical protein